MTRYTLAIALAFTTVLTPVVGARAASGDAAATSGQSDTSPSTDRSADPQKVFAAPPERGARVDLSAHFHIRQGTPARFLGAFHGYWLWAIDAGARTDAGAKKQGARYGVALSDPAGRHLIIPRAVIRQRRAGEPKNLHASLRQRAKALFEKHAPASSTSGSSPTASTTPGFSGSTGGASAGGTRNSSTTSSSPGSHNSSPTRSASTAGSGLSQKQSLAAVDQLVELAKKNMKNGTVKPEAVAQLKALQRRARQQISGQAAAKGKAPGTCFAQDPNAAQGANTASDRANPDAAPKPAASADAGSAATSGTSNSTASDSASTTSASSAASNRDAVPEWRRELTESATASADTSGTSKRGEALDFDEIKKRTHGVWLGNPDAPYEVVAIMDPTCPDCRQLYRKTLTGTDENPGPLMAGTLRVKFVPFSVNHPNGKGPAMKVLARADAENKGWIHRLMHKTQLSPSTTNFTANNAIETMVDQNWQATRDWNVQHTPTIFYPIGDGRVQRSVTDFEMARLRKRYETADAD